MYFPHALDTIIGKKKTSKIICSKTYSAIIDILAKNSFFFTITTINELAIAGMSIKAWLITRALNAIANSIVAVPYRKWREIVFYWFNTKADSSPLRKYLVDTAAYATFQLPMYVITMIIAGAGIKQIIVAGGFALVTVGFIGRPFGIYFDWFRKTAGLESLTIKNK